MAEIGDGTTMPTHVAADAPESGRRAELSDLDDDPRVTQRTVDVDGCDLACWHRPGPGDHWVVLLHGAGVHSSIWTHQLDAFTEANLLLVDLRGHGRSALHPGVRAQFSDVVDDIGAVLDEFGAQRAVIVGHSWGGNPAQEFAHRHCDRVSALVMVGAWGQIRPIPASERRRIDVMSRLYGIVPWRLVSIANARACSDVADTRSRVRDMLRDTGREPFVDLGISAFRAVHDNEGGQPVPTLLVRGSLDAPSALGPIYERIRSRNPEAREVVIDGTRHMPMIDSPVTFNRVLADHLATLAP